MKRFAAILIAPLLLAQTTRQCDVTAIRQWALPAATRIAIEVSGQFQYRWDRLHNPDRVYFDILNSRPKFESGKTYTAQYTDGLAQRVRVAENAPGITRVVLDISPEAEVSASQLTNPYRLMIELKPAGAETPASGAALLPAAPAIAEVAKPAKTSSAGDLSLIRTLGLKIARVVIDPGHGGHDQGTKSPRGMLEKDLVLDVAQRVGALVEERMGAEVVYTRTDDSFVPLEARTQLANDRKADLFLSIHANSSSSSKVAGIETFYLNISGSSKDALDVAARENASSDKSVFELADLIQKIARQDKAEESRQFANSIQKTLYALSKANVPGAKNRGVKKAPFVVLIGANMPSVLAEIGFVSNTREETLLKKADYRQKLAEALYKGISGYADTLSHFELAEAPAKQPATPAKATPAKQSATPTTKTPSGQPAKSAAASVREETRQP